MNKLLRSLSLSILLFCLTAQAFPPTINGFITDSSSGEGLIGANVYLDDFPIGISTNEQGYYVLHPIPPGKHTLRVSFIGYKTFSQLIEFKEGEKKFLNIALIPEAIEGEEVVVQRV